MNRPVLLALALVSCGPAPRPVEPAGAPLMVVERARARPIPDPVRARLHVKAVSGPLDLSSGASGVLIVDRPGNGHLAVMGPMGGPVATLTSDGQALGLALIRERRLLAAWSAEAVLRRSTGAAVGLDDVVGLLLGDVPLDAAPIRYQAPTDDGAVRAVLAGPDGTRLDALIDAATAAPRSLSLWDPTDRLLIRAEYEPFAARDDGTWVPTRVQAEFPVMELSLDIRFREWEVLDQVPEVFGVSAPDGWTVEPLEAAVLGVLQGAAPSLDVTPLDARP